MGDRKPNGDIVAGIEGVGKLRDPKRIEKVLNVIRAVWIKCPDLRLSQLLINAIGLEAGVFFYIEDEVLVKKLEEALSDHDEYRNQQLDTLKNG